MATKAEDTFADPSVLRSVLRLAAVGIATVSPEGRWLSVNSKLCDMLGYSADELTGMTIQDVTHPEEMAESLERIRRCIDGEFDEYGFDKRYIRKDGSEVWVELSVAAVRDERERFQYFIATVTEITDRLRLVHESELSRLTTKIISRFDYRLQDIVEDICATTMALTGSAFGICSYKDPVSGKYVTIKKTAPGISPNFYATGVAALTSRPLWPTLLTSPVVINTDDGNSGLRRDIGDLPFKRLLSAASFVASETAGFLAVADGRGPYSVFHEDIVSSLSAVMGLAAERMKTYLRLSQQSAELDLAVKEMISLVANVVEMRDRYTSGHEIRVADLAARTAKSLGLGAEQVDGVFYSALLHDIGKVGVPLEILSKPGRLLSEEYGLVQRHAGLGRNILANAHLPWPCALVAGQHHERLDGSGYPDGLAGDAIMIESRIVAVCDVIEAMASHRPYRAALGLDVAREEILDKAGSHFDPDVVGACLSVLDTGFEFEDHLALPAGSMTVHRTPV